MYWRLENMKRTTLMLATGGAVVVLATTGAALGVAASNASAPPRNATLVADDSTPEPESFSPSAEAATSGQVSAEQASAIALSRAGGGRITEVEAELEHGRPVWKVELVNGGVKYEVYVDRETGAVVKAEREAAEVRDRHGDDADDRGDDSTTRSGDNSGPGSGDDSDDNSGRDHPEDDATGADDHGGDDHGGDSGSGRDHPEDS
jgi:uncharacterized membrane protein YkoI